MNRLLKRVISAALALMVTVTSFAVPDMQVQAADTARRAGITVVPIYFTNNEDTGEAFRNIYKKNCIVTSPEYMSDELVKVFKKF